MLLDDHLSNTPCWFCPYLSKGKPYRNRFLQVDHVLSNTMAAMVALFLWVIWTRADTSRSSFNCKCIPHHNKKHSMSMRAKQRVALWYDMARHDSASHWFLCCLQWSVKPALLDEFMRTEQFISHRKEWCRNLFLYTTGQLLLSRGVHLRAFFGSHFAITVMDLSRTNPVHVECQALLIAQSLPGVSCMQSEDSFNLCIVEKKKNTQWRIVLCGQEAFVDLLCL